MTTTTTTTTPTTTKSTSKSTTDKEATAMAGPWVDEHNLDSPIAPCTIHDDRPAVKDLIAEHSHKIDKLRASLVDDPLYDPIKHDDLWLLRYMLSHKKLDKATIAAKATMVYRKHKQLDDTDIRTDWPCANCEQPNVVTYFNCIEDGGLVFSLPHKDRSMLMMVNYAKFDLHKLVQELTMDEWPFGYCTEWSFQMLDSITRRTGRLTKSIRIVDLDGFQSKQYNKENIKRDAATAKEMEDYYPQALRSLYIVNAPFWFATTFKVMRPLMPKRFVEKFNVIAPLKNKKEFQLFLKHVSEEHLPTKLGGMHEGYPYPNQIIK